MRPSRSTQRLPRNRKDAIVPAACRWPHERQRRKRFFHALAVVPHFDYEQATFVQVCLGVHEDLSHEIEPIVSARERERRLAPVLSGKLSHDGLANVGRVRDDEIVATAGKLRIKIRSNDANSGGELVIIDITSCNFERIRRNVGRVDSRALEGLGEDDCEAAGARAKVQYVLYAQGIVQPRPQVFAQELRDIRSRNDHALVDVKTIIAEPGFMREISGGLARANPLVDQALDAQHVITCKHTRQVGCRIVRRQVKSVKDEPRGLVPRVCRAVPEAHTRRFKSARGPAKR